MTSKNTKLAAGLAAVAAALVGWAALAPATLTMTANQWAPAPVVAAGKDNAPGDGAHHPGEDCGVCHAPPSLDPLSVYTPAGSSRVFTLTATFMDGRAGRRAAPGGEVVLVDYAGNAVSFTANDVGNAFTEAAISPDLSVSTTFEPERWRYKAWVRQGGMARPMMTIPAVGGMKVPRMSCGMHHVQTGTMGSLAAAPGATLRSYPATGLGFRRHVFPILRSKCAPCHVPGPTTASQNGESFDYGAGLDLMSLDGSNVVVHGSAGDTAYPKLGIRAVVATSAPDASLLLTKPLQGGPSPHGGGVFWTTPDHPDYRAIRQWIAEGANDN